MMKKTIYPEIALIIYLVIAIISVILFVGCTEENITGQAVRSQEPIKIGATLAMTGDIAFNGQQESKGLQLAVDEINSKGGINGRPLQLIIEDNKGLAKEAVSSVKKLISVDDVDVVFSVFIHITGPIKDIVQAEERILFYHTSTTEFAEEYKYGFKDFFDIKENARVLVEGVADRNHKKIVFLSEISDACVEFEKAIKKESLKHGIEIVAEELYQVPEKSLRTEILRLDLENADALIGCTWRHEHILMKELKELDLIDVQTFHVLAPYLPYADTPELRELYAENNAISVWYGIAENPDNEKQQAFIARFKERYGVSPNPDSVYAYDDVYLLADAMERCGGVDNDCIAKVLTSTKYDGVGGPIEFDKDGVSKRDVFLITIEDGEWVRVG